MSATEATAPDALGRPRRIARRRPRWSELRELLRWRSVEFDSTRRRLARVHTIDDLRDEARRRTPRSVYEYVVGGAEQEISISRARTAFERVEFRPRVLRDVESVDPSTSILGAPSALPLVLAPTGFTRMMHHEGEVAVARAADRFGVPYTLSTMGTTSLEDVRAVAPSARHWFQLYLWKDRYASLELVDRANAAGYEALVLTVDTPVGGARLRDVRNGLTIPPTLSLRTVLNMAVHPSWWFNLLSTEPLAFASLNRFGGTVEQLIATMFDPTVVPADVAMLREHWPRKLLIKGIQSVEDAVLVADLGADAVVVSTHGGRQLDRAVTPLELLPQVVDAVDGRCEVLVDTGVSSGADLVAARSLGASAAMVGRAYLFGLMAGGERGVDRSIEILASEVRRTLQLLGVTCMDGLTGAEVRLRDRVR